MPVNFGSEPGPRQSAFQALWFNTVNRDSKAAAVILPDCYTPHNLLLMSLCSDNTQGYKVKVQSENISASHLSPQTVMLTGLWNSLDVTYQRHQAPV